VAEAVSPLTWISRESVEVRWTGLTPGGPLVTGMERGMGGGSGEAREEREAVRWWRRGGRGRGR